MTLNRRSFLMSALAPPALPQAGEPHSAVVITADNLGYGDIGCYGNREIRTPNLDAFARQGARFTNFYTASPTCTASRAALLTGRHPLRYGLNYQLSPAENMTGIGLPQSERLIPAYLKPRGYATACIGKWNLGFAPGSRPTERGFDEFFGHRSGNMDYYTHLYNGELDTYRGIEPVRMEGYCTDLFAGAACDFLRRHSRRKFFLYLAFNAPHYPNPRNLRPGEKLEWQAPPEYFRRYGYQPDEADERKRYRAVVTALDDAFGRVIRQIDALKLTNRTLIWFYSDNGAFMQPGRGLEVASNAPLRGGGATCQEGGIRVAAMARWPGRIPAGGTCRELLSSLDILPHVFGASQTPHPDGLVLDGRDPAAVLAGKAASPHEALCFEYLNQQAVRSGRWKLLRPGKDRRWQLFDLEKDVGESVDVAERQPEVASRLAGRFEQWRREIQAPR